MGLLGYRRVVVAKALRAELNGDVVPLCAQKWRRENWGFGWALGPSPEVEMYGGGGLVVPKTRDRGKWLLFGRSSS